MAHPKSGKGNVDGTFSKRISDLEKKAQKISESFRNQSYAEWHVPDEIQDLMDVPGLDKAWQRNGINREYENIVGKQGDAAGSVGAARAMKMQADFLAVEERAFRTRHASLVRCAAMAHGRLDGHGKAGNGIFSFIKEGVQSAIDLGNKTGG
jgi:hypothetical protein